MPVCAIDFGTSNTSVFVADQTETRTVLVDPQSKISETAPTISFYPNEEGQFHGTPAARAYVDYHMDGRFIQSLKRHLPSSSFTKTVIRGSSLPIDWIVAQYLRWLKDAAEAEAGSQIETVLLGRPARYHTYKKNDDLAQQRMYEAATRAGFANIAFQLEPIAAARDFERSLSDDILCLVCDLGGGTSDFTIMKLGPSRLGGKREKDVVASTGVSIGGNDFDACLIRHGILNHFGFDALYHPAEREVPVPTYLHHSLTAWHQLHFAASDASNIAFLDSVLRTVAEPGRQGIAWLREFLSNNYGFAFFGAVEDCKIQLSSHKSATFNFEAGTISIHDTISRASFERSVAGLLATISGTIDSMFVNAGLRFDDVSTVFLTGGTSQIPCVANLFNSRFSGRIIARDAFVSVGRGLAVEARERLIAGRL